ncbi:hypothetical protein CL634_06435 [bacterium]|nr:hypothetical protein [bacterium]
MNRIHIINFLAEKIRAKDYLELGVSRGICFARINVENKIGVDIKTHNAVRGGNVTHVMTSDDFFEQNDKKFDLIFVDGLHVEEQVKRDILNSVECLNDGGYIVCHDMSPKSEEKQNDPPEWNGTCWRAWVRIRSERDDLDMSVVDVDQGCGVITKNASQKLIINEDLTWKNLVKNRKEWLNLVSVEKFRKEHGE